MKLDIRPILILLVLVLMYIATAITKANTSYLMWNQGVGFSVDQTGHWSVSVTDAEGQEPEDIENSGTQSEDEMMS